MGLSYFSYDVRTLGGGHNLSNVPTGSRDGEVLEIANSGTSQVQLADTAQVLFREGSVTLEPGDTVRLLWSAERWRETGRVAEAAESSFSAVNSVEWVNVADHTALLQNVLVDAGHIYLGPGVWVISDWLTIKSNTRLQLHPEAVIKRSVAMPEFAIAIFVPYGTTNVIIEGGRLDGNKQSEEVGAGGRAMGIGILGGQDVIVRDMIIYNWPADVTGGS